MNITFTKVISGGLLVEVDNEHVYTIERGQTSSNLHVTKYTEDTKELTTEQEKELIRNLDFFNIANDIIDNDLTKLILSKAKESSGTPTVGDLENIYQQIKLNM